ncbi:sigma-70 family RNA polymerase sigma factor [Clostridiisalibacter paucivorans]|uniref:sigma-70 family RNA polymerase sigma factor n=1 Tax=Clostridiisalibacter paucivorans TaxID=408753 RepID=UPI00047B7B7B|nr:sigma-70 family RNA polymerase sigma factor [Clostridiisalibacter paucivorans]
MNDREHILIKKSIKGDIDAFEKLIEKHEKRAYNIALKMLKNPDDAMDVSQEALIKVYRYIKGFNEKSSFSTWLYRIVVNTCIDYLRKNKERHYSLDNPINTSEGEIKREVADDTSSPEKELEKTLNKELIHSSINKLEDIHKTVIILRDIEGFSYEEIAKILDCSLGTVKSRIKRGRDNLKQIIVKEMEHYDETVV